MRGAEWTDSQIEQTKKEIVCDGNECKIVESKVDTSEKVPEKSQENKNKEERDNKLYDIINEDQEIILSSTDLDKTMKFKELVEGRKAKLVAIYCSMHRCPPCRAFTPLLAELYNEVNEDEHILEIIFMSGDKAEEEFKEYYAEMPWLAFPRGNKELEKRIAKTFEVKGVPRLIMLKASDGKCLSNNCNDKVEKEGPAAIMQFLQMWGQTAWLQIDPYILKIVREFPKSITFK